MWRWRHVQRRGVHFAAKAVTQADLLFTVPGVLLLFLNGMALAPAFGGDSPFGASWVVAALGLLILSGVVWAGYLLRYQAQMIALSASGDTLSNDFYRAFRNWGIWRGSSHSAAGGLVRADGVQGDAVGVISGSDCPTGGYPASPKRAAGGTMCRRVGKSARGSHRRRQFPKRTT